MDWDTKVVVFGLLAFTAFILSIVFARRKMYKLGMLFAELELPPAIISCSAWAWALKVSGKSDWYLFGLRICPPVALIFYAMLIAGFVCFIVNFCLLLKKLGAAAEDAAQA